MFGPALDPTPTRAHHGHMSERRCSDSAARALWWVRALGVPVGKTYRAPGLIPFSPDRVPKRRGWSAWAHRGDPCMLTGMQRDWLARSARDLSWWAWALLPGQAGLVVVDVDDPDLLPELIQLYGDTPVKVRTPRGGTHLYYLAPADPDKPGSVPGDDIGPAVQSRTGVRGPHSYDIKADGQPCHCPGQRHHMLRDRLYEVDVPGGWRGGTGPDAWRVGELRALLPEFRLEAANADWAAHNPQLEAPEHLDEHILAGTPDERKMGARYLAAAGPAVTGSGGHDHTRKLILKLGDLGFPKEIGSELLHDWNRTCEPPWSQRDLDSKIEHYYQRRSMPIGWRAAELEVADEYVDDEPGELASHADEVSMLARMVAGDLGDGAASVKIEPPAEAVVPDVVAARGPTAAATYELARRAAFAVRKDGGARAAVAAAIAAVGGVLPADASEIIAEVFGADALPHVDIADLFADVPAVADQCIAAQESLRMSSADVPALFALGFASAALAARCRIEMEPGWRPPPHLFVIASVPSGRGKSGAVERMGGVLQRRWQADVGREWDEIALAAAVQRDTARALYSDYQRQAVRLRKVINEGGRKGESLVEASASLEVIEGHLRKAQLEIQAAHLSKPTWIQADSTPEKFVNLVKEFGFALLVAGEGATILQAFTQGSMGRNRVAALLSAWTGEALDRARVGGPNSVVVVDRYAELHACMVLPVQNFLLEPSGEDRERTTILRELAAAGFFARCLVAREEVTGTCEAPVEFDDTWVGVPWVTCARHVAAKNAWEELLSDIWLSGYRPPPAQPLAPERPDEPYSIQLVPEARDYLLRFQRWAAEQTKTGGRWAAERVAESAARVGEQAMRVAAVLAVMRCRSCVDVKVTLAEAERAVRFCKDYAMPLIEHLLERAKPDPIADDADVVHKRVADLQVKHPGGVPKRVLQQRLGRGWGKADVNARTSRVDAALEHLETIGVVRLAKSEKGAIMSILILPAKARPT